MRSRGMMALAAALAFSGPALAHAEVTPWRKPVTGEGTFRRERGLKGRSRSMRNPRTSLEAYKAQRRANRLRRKALNK